MIEKLRACGKNCVFWCESNSDMHYSSKETRCQIHAAAHPSVRNDKDSQFKPDEPCYFGILSSFDYRNHGINHDELVELANSVPELFKRKLSVGDVRAYFLAAYVQEALSQRSPSCKESNTIGGIGQEDPF